MTSNDWQERVLPDEELQAVLASVGALEGMQVLQRQLELRSQGHESPAELRSEVPNHLELGLTGFVPVATESEPLLVEPAAEPLGTSEAPASAARAEAVPSESQAAGDIVSSLNAMFANRQKVSFEAPDAAPKQSVSEPEPEGSRVGEDQSASELLESAYAPVPLESDTKSFFIPTFANPLPNTESVPVVTPMLDSVPKSSREATPSTPEALAVDVTEVATPVAPLPIVAASPEATEPESESDVPALQETDIQESEIQSFVDADIPSAEEAITAFEEADTTSTAQPTLVDEVILAVGGESDGFPLIEPEDSTGASQVASPAEPDIEAGKYGFGALLATWNGTGNLLFLIAAGFIAASLGLNLVTVAAGAFGAMAAAGFGFGTAALSARRGRQPQATISRAAFGVRGAAIPMVLVMLAKYAATSVATIGCVFALVWFFPALPAYLTIGEARVDSFYIVLLVLLVLSTFVTVLGSAARYIVTAAVAVITLMAVLVILGATAASSPATLSFTGSIDAGKALALASALIILVSVIWGTTAADETPLLRSRIPAPQLLASGLLSHAILGTLAVLAGYAYFGIQAPWLKNEFVGGGFALLAVLALSHQLRRSADSFTGFGLSGTRWWVVVLSSVLVAVAVFAGHLFTDENTLKAAALSLLPVAGVPVVAWLAIYGMDSVLRRDDYHEVSLLRDYGFYGKLRVTNLAGWLLAVVVGFGFVESNVPGFGWLGYLGRPLGFAATGSQADTGVWLAFVIGLLSPLLTLSKIRDQEAEGRALLARHKELVNVLGEL